MKAKWKRRAIGATILVASVALFHSAILSALARVLIVNQPAEDFQWICVVTRTSGPDGDRCYDVAEKLFREKSTRQVLLVGSAGDRLAEVGVLPSFEELGRKQLGLRGVPSEAIAVASGNGDSYRSVAETLATWLRSHPGAGVEVLCAQFRSALMRAALDARLDPSQAEHVRVRALADRRFNETDWWWRRAGFREFGIAWLMRLQGWAGSGQGVERPPMTADEYERTFARKVGK